MLSFIKLTENDFDSRGDFQFKKGEIQQRGGYPYYQPSCPYERIGLRVMGRYDNGNDDWLKMDGRKGEWAVAFHGVRSEFAIQIIPGILKFGLHPGTAQMQKDKPALDLDGNAKGQVPKGIYCTPKFEVALQYTEKQKIEGCEVVVIFQCRVKPSAVRVCKNCPDYWVVEKSEDIRPYGIVSNILKNASQQEDSSHPHQRSGFFSKFLNLFSK